MYDLVLRGMNARQWQQSKGCHEDRRRKNSKNEIWNVPSMLGSVILNGFNPILSRRKNRKHKRPRAHQRKPVCTSPKRASRQINPKRSRHASNRSRTRSAVSLGPQVRWRQNSHQPPVVVHHRNRRHRLCRENLQSLLARGIGGQSHRVGVVNQLDRVLRPNPTSLCSGQGRLRHHRNVKEALGNRNRRQPRIPNLSCSRSHRSGRPNTRNRPHDGAHRLGKGSGLLHELIIRRAKFVPRVPGEPKAASNSTLGNASSSAIMSRNSRWSVV